MIFSAKKTAQQQFCRNVVALSLLQSIRYSGCAASRFKVCSPIATSRRHRIFPASRRAMAMKAMKVAKKSTAMKAAKAAKVAAPPKRTAMKKQATKSKHTTWSFWSDEWIALARV